MLHFTGAYDIDTCIDTLEYCGTADLVGSAWGNDGSSHVSSSNQTAKCWEVKPIDKISLFEKFSQSGLHRLGLSCSNEIDFAGLWKETEPFSVSYSHIICHFFSLMLDICSYFTCIGNRKKFVPFISFFSGLDTNTSSRVKFMRSMLLIDLRKWLLRWQMCCSYFIRKRDCDIYRDKKSKD